jgi:hypothetical protein
MNMPGKDCLWGIVFFALIFFSLTDGCICGPSPPGHTIGGNNNSSGDIVVIENNTAASAEAKGAGDMATPTPRATPTPWSSALTIYVDGGKDHKPGETLRFYGMSTRSGVIYLFISCTSAPVCGGRLDNLQKAVVDLDAATFIRVNVSEDGSWEYRWTVPGGRPALMFDLYNIIASAEPRDKSHLDEASAWDMVTVKISQSRV